jgi:peptidoglycan/xylan/chitin deacetylase (PgdA/CDA1 family)
MTLVSAIMAAFLVMTPIIGTTRYANAASSPSSCKCVIFRLDDIQGWWEHDLQVAVLDTFMQTNTKVTTALVMNSYGNETSVINKVTEGQEAGLFEIALHGWKHDDYGLKSLDEQRESLAAANNKLYSLNGIRSNIFVAPYNSINSDTLDAMKQVGLQIVSADVSPDNGYLPPAFPQIDDSSGVLSIPYTVNFIDERRELQSNGKTLEQLTSEVDSSVSKRGWAVIVLHPQDLALYDTGGNEPTILPTVNDTKMDTLRSLINELKTDGKTITSFNVLAANILSGRIENDRSSLLHGSPSAKKDEANNGDNSSIVASNKVDPTIEHHVASQQNLPGNAALGNTSSSFSLIAGIALVATTATLLFVYRRHSHSHQ